MIFHLIQLFGNNHECNVQDGRLYVDCDMYIKEENAFCCILFFYVHIIFYNEFNSTDNTVPFLPLVLRGFPLLLCLYPGYTGSGQHCVWWTAGVLR